MREQARKVEDGVKSMSEACDKGVREILGEMEKKDVVLAAGTYDVDGRGRPSGADGVFWDSQQEGGKVEAPVVKSWSGSELIWKVRVGR